MDDEDEGEDLTSDAEAYVDGLESSETTDWELEDDLEDQAAAGVEIETEISSEPEGEGEADATYEVEAEPEDESEPA
jgi:hypothetical protein